MDEVVWWLVSSLTRVKIIVHMNNRLAIATPILFRSLLNDIWRHLLIWMFPNILVWWDITDRCIFFGNFDYFFNIFLIITDIIIAIDTRMIHFLISFGWCMSYKFRICIFYWSTLQRSSVLIIIFTVNGQAILKLLRFHPTSITDACPSAYLIRR